MTDKNVNSKKIYLLSVTVTVVFFLTLTAFLIAGIIEPDKEYSETENRRLASFPSVSFDSVTDGSFMTDFEAYMSDRFFGRNTFVSLKTSISRILGETEINDVYIGKNGRLYEVPSVFSKERTDKTVNAVLTFSDKCNIPEQYFMLIPNASYVIPDELPLFLECENQAEQIEAVYSVLNSSLVTVDAVSPLINAENKDELFFRTDHHWTSSAAKLVFDQLGKCMKMDEYKKGYACELVSNSFAGTLASSSGISDVSDCLEIILPADIEGNYFVRNFDTLEKSLSVLEPEKLNTKNQYEVFFGGNFSRLVIRTVNMNEKNILIFKDSYANCFIPLLIPHFESITVIDPRYFTGNIEDILGDSEFTHLLYLYNVNTFLEDTVLSECLD